MTKNNKEEAGHTDWLARTGGYARDYMTLRDRFAMQALPAVLYAAPARVDKALHAEIAYEMADAMLKERNK